jgi:HEAT repeat protein
MGEPVVPELTDAVKGTDITAATRAAFALGRIGPKAKAAVPTLSNTLKITPRENTLLRFRIAEALGLIGPDAKSAASSLIDALRSDDYRVRMGAEKALEAIGPDAAMVPELIGVMKEENANGRIDASKVLAKVGKPAVPALMELLSSTDADLLVPTIYALDEIGPDAKAAVTKLGFLLNEDDDMVKKAVQKALKDIDPAEAARRGVK